MKKERLILENRTDLPMQDFLEMVAVVIRMGRISNNDRQYCYLLMFERNGKKYRVVSDLNGKSDKLTLVEELVKN